MHTVYSLSFSRDGNILASGSLRFFFKSSRSFFSNAGQRHKLRENSRLLSHGQQPCKFIAIKESVYIGKKIQFPQPTGLTWTLTWPPFHCCPDVLCKHSVFWSQACKKNCQCWFQCLRYVQWNLPSVTRSKVRGFLFLPGGVDNCVKLWNARSICNPDDEEEEGSDAK